MTIPEGAVAKGCREEMFLAILREDKDRLKLAGIVVIVQPQKFWKGRFYTPEHRLTYTVFIMSNLIGFFIILKFSIMQVYI